MLGYKRPAQPSSRLGDALNAGHVYPKVHRHGCDTHQTVPLDIIRGRKTMPIHELDRYMRCKQCSELRGRPYKRAALVAFRQTKISTKAPAPSGGPAIGEHMRPTIVWQLFVSCLWQRRSRQHSAQNITNADRVGKLKPIVCGWRQENPSCRDADRGRLCDLFSMTKNVDAIVAPIHPNAMPVILPHGGGIRHMAARALAWSEGPTAAAGRGRSHKDYRARVPRKILLHWANRVRLC
jgi:hypothetical protein